MTHPDADDPGNEPAWSRAFAQELGNELRQEREQSGLTPAEVITRSGVDITENTLLAYENGASQDIPARTIIRIYRAFNTDPDAAMLRAHLLSLARTAALTIDLTALTNTNDNRLRPLRPWAAQRTPGLPLSGGRTMRLNADDWEHLADLCDMDLSTLVQLLLFSRIVFENPDHD